MVSGKFIGRNLLSKANNPEQALRVAIAGGSGKMGRMLIAAVIADPRAQLSGVLERQGHVMVGHPCPDAPDVAISDQLDEVLGVSDVLIDFTRPEATRLHVAACQRQRCALVIGTTGLTADDHALMTEVARHIPIVQSPNMAVGVNATFKLLEVAAKILGAGFDVEVIEAHHRHKVDAPSGTALKMGQVVADALGIDLQRHAIYGREGHTGERDSQTIGFSTIRAGDIIGDHTVLFAGPGERVEITHRSSGRDIYAHGALRAAHFVKERLSGLYDMQDVLGLRRGVA